MRLENGMDRLIRKGLTGIGILAFAVIGFYGGRLASVTTVNGEATLNFNRAHVRATFSTYNGGRFRVNSDVFLEEWIVASDVEVGFSGWGWARGRTSWDHGLHFKVNWGTSVPPLRPSDESS